MYKGATRPSKQEQRLAMESYDTLNATLRNLKVGDPEIEIEETKESIRIPLKALKLLAVILKATSQGKPVSIVPHATEMTTQAAAEFLGCSRPHLVRLLEEGNIPFTKIGKHRRIKFEDMEDYRKRMKSRQKERLIDIIKTDEEAGLYDS